jgi:hypothetical protein
MMRLDSQMAWDSDPQYVCLRVDLREDGSRREPHPQEGE